jgi:putative FmdB family regulatory protein
MVTTSSIAGRTLPGRAPPTPLDRLALRRWECQPSGYDFRAMPIYEYRCEKGHTFEVLQRMSDDALERCEVCEAPAARVLHAPAVHFKGSGFYNTDYGTKKRAREKGAAEGSGDGKAKSGGEGAGGDGRASSASDGGAKKADAGAASSAA